MPRKAVDWRVRFWKKVEVGGPDECWEWSGARLPTGYGRLNMKTDEGWVVEYAHRLMAEIALGFDRGGPLFVLHRCDNPPCVNPRHLFLGTQDDNMADRNRKGRQARGVRMGGSKLDPFKVRLIRGLRDAGGTCRLIAPMFGVRKETVYAVYTRATWKHVP